MPPLRDLGLSITGAALVGLLTAYSSDRPILGLWLGLAAGVALGSLEALGVERPLLAVAFVGAIVVAVLAGLAVRNGGATKVTVEIEAVVPKWNSTVYEGSHWNATIAWSTRGADECTIDDDQHTAPQTVAAIRRQTLEYGSYSPEILKAVLRVRCDRGGSRASHSRTSRRPAGPLVRIDLGRFYGMWLTPAHANWEVRMTWTSRNAVDCGLDDSYRPNPDGYHNDPAGALDRGYGNFPATLESVRVRIVCINVAKTATEKAVRVARPPL